MRDALVTIDTGFASFDLPFESVLSAGAKLLLIEIHVLELVTVSTLMRIRCFHVSPHALGQVHAPCLEFLARIDGSYCPVRNFMQRRLDLSRHFVKPLFWHVAIGTNSAYARAVGVVDGLLVFLVDVIFHDMAGDTEGFGIGIIKHHVEARPK